MNKPMIIAGPCAVESKDQIMNLAMMVRDAGANYLRGCIFKPRTHPDSYQGIGEEGIHYLVQARERTGLKIVTEVLDIEKVHIIGQITDMFQIGSRNMHNSSLLKYIALTHPVMPILLKRGFAATLLEVEGALAYLKEYGHSGDVYICERGIRTFADGDYSRSILDLNFVSYFKNRGYSVIVDPSHAAGRADLVEQLSYAGIATGADGLLIEVSAEPYLSKALSDKNQHITPDVLKRIITNSSNIKSVLTEQ